MSGQISGLEIVEPDASAWERLTHKALLGLSPSERKEWLVLSYFNNRISSGDMSYWFYIFDLWGK